MAAGYTRAIDPLTGQSKWAIPNKVPNFAGTLVTAGNIVFTGRLTGEFIALDAETGKTLWEFQTRPESSDSRSPGSRTASNTSPSPTARPAPT